MSTYFYINYSTYSVISGLDGYQGKLEKTSRAVAEQSIINAARNVLLTIQNDSSLTKDFTWNLNEAANLIHQKASLTSHLITSISLPKTMSRPGMTGFLILIEEFQRYAVRNINVPFQVDI